MEQVLEFLLTQGVLGVVVVGLIFDRLRLERKNDKLQLKIDELQEARRLDAVETRTDVTSVLPGISQSLENISAKIEIAKASKK